jgi:ArsR family transcriptional regulator
MNNYKNEVKTFKALTDINRLLILDLLMNGETCSCMMIEKLPIKQSTISHHMKILIDSELVEERKDGKYSYYSLSKSGINSAIEYLNKYLNAKSGLCICSKKKQ